MNNDLVIKFMSGKIGVRRGAKIAKFASRFPWIVLLISWSVLAIFYAKRIAPDTSMGVVFLVTFMACAIGFGVCTAIAGVAYGIYIDEEKINSYMDGVIISWNKFLIFVIVLGLLCFLIAKYYFNYP